MQTITNILAILKAHESVLIVLLWIIGAFLFFIRGVVSLITIRVYIRKALYWLKEGFEEKGKTSSKRLTVFGLFWLLSYAVYESMHHAPGYGNNDVAIIMGLGGFICTILGVAGYVTVRNKKIDADSQKS